MTQEGDALNKAASIINSSETAKSEGAELLARWKKFVTDNKLAFKAPDGQVYLKVEAWNYLFSMNRMSATITDISRIPTEEGTIYIAKAALMPMSKDIPKDGVPLGATAFGACRVEEDNLFKDDFSALSMAQTRAVGKLGRTVYAHLAIACGYKATPLEEMGFSGDK